MVYGEYRLHACNRMLFFCPASPDRVSTEWTQNEALFSFEGRDWKTTEDALTTEGLGPNGV
jgi:hypothetical protein